MKNIHLELAKLVRKRAGTAGILRRRGARVLDYLGDDALIEKHARENFEELVPEGLKLPASTLLALTPIVTTPKIDRDGDRLETSGAVVAKRLPLLWQHDANKPLGKAVATLVHDSKMLKLASVILKLKGHEALAEDAAILVEADVLGISHGFRALEWDTLKDTNGKETGGFHVTKFEIMEHSLVSVPSNTDALIEQYSRGKLASPEVKEWAKQAFDSRKKVHKLGTIQVDVKFSEQKTRHTKDAKQLQTKRYGDSQWLPESWEAIESDLHRALPKHLEANGIKMPYGMYAYSIGTYADSAVVVVCGSGENGRWEDFYRMSWEMGDGGPAWTGEPEKVAVQVVVTPDGKAAFPPRAITAVKPTEEKPAISENDADGVKKEQTETAQEVTEKTTPEKPTLEGYIRAADLSELKRGARLLARLVEEAEREEFERELDAVFTA